MFNITSSHDFLWKLEADFDDFVEEPHSARLALNCALTAYHLHEWVRCAAGAPAPGLWKFLMVRGLRLIATVECAHKSHDTHWTSELRRLE